MAMKRIIYKYKFGVVTVLIALMALSCDSLDSGKSLNDSGEGGSTSRFVIVGDYMYVVDNMDLKVFDVSEPANPIYLKENYIGFGIETLFAMDEYLFIGSGWAMYIYSITDPESPVEISSVSHITACDPVVSDGDFAYVTLHTGSACGNTRNVLYVYDIGDIENPQEVNALDLHSPKGLAVNDSLLVVCDQYEVVVYDKTNAPQLSQSFTLSVQANDVILLGDVMLLVGDKGLYEYGLHNDGAVKLGSVLYSENVN